MELINAMFRARSLLLITLWQQFFERVLESPFCRILLTYLQNVNEHFRFFSDVSYLHIKMEIHTPKQGLINIQS